MSPANNIVVFQNTTTGLYFNCSGGTYGYAMLTLNGSEPGNITMEGMSYGNAQDPATGINYDWLSILPIVSNNNINITCNVIDMNGACVESNSLRIQIQGNVLI